MLSPTYHVSAGFPRLLESKIVRPWKVPENGFGPGKSQHFLGYDVGGGHNDAGANLWLPLDTQNRKSIQLQGALAPHTPDRVVSDNLFAVSQ